MCALFCQKNTHIYSKAKVFFKKTQFLVGGTEIQGPISNFNITEESESRDQCGRAQTWNIAKLVWPTNSVVNA